MNRGTDEQMNKEQGIMNKEGFRWRCCFFNGSGLLPKVRDCSLWLIAYYE
jgi:hypothetical protein